TLGAEPRLVVAPHGELIRAIGEAYSTAAAPKPRVNSARLRRRIHSRPRSLLRCPSLSLSLSLSPVFSPSPPRSSRRPSSSRSPVSSPSRQRPHRRLP